MMAPRHLQEKFKLLNHALAGTLRKYLSPAIFPTVPPVIYYTPEQFQNASRNTQVHTELACMLFCDFMPLIILWVI